MQCVSKGQSIRATKYFRCESAHLWVQELVNLQVHSAQNNQACSNHWTSACERLLFIWDACNNNHDLADIVTTEYDYICLYQRAVNNNHDLADIVTTEYGYICLYQRAVSNNHDLADIVTTEYGYICLYQRAVSNNHDLANSVTTEHLFKSHQLLSYFCRSDSLTDVLRVVSCKVWFGFRLVMQFTP